MALSAHLEQLTSKHASLEQKIQNEMRSPLPDQFRISQLKKEKLHLKEELLSKQS
ncbi:hypothetical protein DES40_2427 [Litorimonas taeanensis]|uniref:DUF465 domain-containing protein n=1 Tax=Litorimonas taeanensis TaxID=568099 RepID=A0A420WF60_9PROT|nr:YdcH family protein [Litorimonas taeanensis]RKQ69624.1 hypothetical protein DES40_2427 [Litorimonas taeanensis]